MAGLLSLELSTQPPRPASAGGYGQELESGVEARSSEIGHGVLSNPALPGALLCLPGDVG